MGDGREEKRDETAAETRRVLNFDLLVGFLVGGASAFNDNRSQKPVLLCDSKEKCLFQAGRIQNTNAEMKTEVKKGKAIDYDYNIICVSIS